MASSVVSPPWSWPSSATSAQATREVHYSSRRSCRSTRATVHDDDRPPQKEGILDFVCGDKDFGSCRVGRSRLRQAGSGRRLRT
jgi:hypothetical protein